MSASEQAIQDTLDDRSISDWLKYALSAARERDCVDAARDAHVLAALLTARRDEILERERPEEDEREAHIQRVTQGRTIWNSDGTDGPCLICPPSEDERSFYQRGRAEEGE